MFILEQRAYDTEFRMDIKKKMKIARVLNILL